MTEKTVRDEVNEGRSMRPSVRLARLLDHLAASMLAMITFAMCAQVIGRYVFSKAPVWSEDFAKYLMAWLTMTMAASLLRDDAHISVTLLVDSFGSKLRALVGVLRDAILLVMSGALIYYGYQFALVGLRSTSSSLNISMAIPYSAIAVGGTLIAAVIVLRRLEDVFIRNRSRS